MTSGDNNSIKCFNTLPLLSPVILSHDAIKCGEGLRREKNTS
jgi:hypothetical protein